MSSKLPVHPVLAAVYPIAFLYSHNIKEAPALQAVWFGAVSLLISGLLLLLVWLLLRDGRKAAIITTSFVVLFFSFGHAAEALKSLGRGFAPSPIYLTLFWALLFSVAVFLVVKTRDLTAATSMLNIIWSVMLVFALVGIVTYRAEARDIWKELDSIDQNVAQAAASQTGLKDPRPDIYYIILDSYPDNSTLKNIFGYDNGRFTDYLSEKGFYVAGRSRSNYVLTYLSLASSLNMKYINYLDQNDQIKESPSTIPYQMVKNNLAARFLRDFGYKFVHFDSGWSGTAHNKYADEEVRMGGDNEFMMMVMETSMLRLAEKQISFIRDDERGRRLNTFARLAEIPLRPEPTFTFAHMIFPHPPFFFTAEGKPIVRQKYSWGGAGWAQRDKYRDQLIFANKKVMETIDLILERSKTPPIIIVQGDHGPASSFYVEGDGSWRDPTDRQLKERTGILNAYYFPGKKSALLRRDISPVNTFRIVFNDYFGADYDLLEDRVFYSNYTDPFKFTDVSARIRQSPPRSP